MDRKIESLCHVQRESADSDVLNYWERRIAEKELYALSQIVLAVPSTQVSVDRAFSGLPLVLTERKINVSKETLNKILIVKLNSELLNDIRVFQ